MLDAVERRPNLAVDADLTLAVDGRDIDVRAYDDLVAVELPSLGAAVALWRGRPFDQTDAAVALAAAGLTVELRVRGAPVARLGAKAVPGDLTRRLGFGPVELYPEGALLALVSARRG
nr:hypothetical protein [Haloarcula salina]